jgi:hypothetical protein
MSGAAWSWLWWALTVWALSGTCILLLGVAAAYAVRQVRQAWHDTAWRSDDERAWEAELRKRAVR